MHIMLILHKVGIKPGNLFTIKVLLGLFLLYYAHKVNVSEAMKIENKLKTVYEIRLENAKILAEKFKSMAGFAEFLGKSRNFMHRVMNDSYSKNIGNDLAREIESKFNKPHGWLDHEHKKKEKYTEVPIFKINEIKNKSNHLYMLKVEGLKTELNYFGLLVEKKNSTHMFQAGAIIIFSSYQNEKIGGDLVLLCINNVVAPYYCYVKDNNNFFLDLKMREEPKYIENPNILGIAVKLINLDHQLNVSIDEFQT